MTVIESLALGIPRSRHGDDHGGGDLGTTVRRGVDALTAALAEGSVHHHRDDSDVPAHRRAPDVETVRAWAAGADLDEQRRVCSTCSRAAWSA